MLPPPHSCNNTPDKPSMTPANPQAIPAPHQRKRTRAFTLIELSIVLVIIGLIVGGVLVGRDLIKAAEVRSQIAQIQDIQTAITTFKGRYNYLPGDIPEPDATRFGFSARGPYQGQGDGNGVLEGNTGGAFLNDGNYYFSGENLVAWRDLSTAKLIKENFTIATATSTVSITLTNQNRYFPISKLSADSILYLHSTMSQNYLGIMNEFTGSSMSVSQAYSIDKKIDDGKPGSGRIMAFFYGVTSMGEYVWLDFTQNATISTSATPASSTTCYDNNNITGREPSYSINYNNGNGFNCALSIRLE